MKNIFLLMSLVSSTSFSSTLYLGADIGASQIQSSINSEVEKKSGLAADVKGFLNFDLTESLNSDLGLGYLYNQVKGSSSLGDVKITTKLIYLDADIKYNLSKQSSLGPVVNMFMGTNTDFSEVEEGNKTNPFLGLKYAYKLDSERPMRFDARIISSTDEAKTLMALVGFSVGFDLSSKTASQSNIKAEIMPPLEIDEEKPDLTFTLKSARVLFDTNVYELDKELEAKIKRLAKYLILNGEEWVKLKISGHTDNRGSREFNVDLSSKRAKSVADTFINAGVDEKKVLSKGYGFDRPRDSRNTPEALEKNRRTEIEFFGIKNKERFNKALIEILK
jgi:outer membrane protein OmpA-like peptidoglycan-associated protein